MVYLMAPSTSLWLSTAKPPVGIPDVHAELITCSCFVAAIVYTTYYVEGFFCVEPIVLNWVKCLVHDGLMLEHIFREGRGVGSSKDLSRHK